MANSAQSKVRHYRRQGFTNYLQINPGLIMLSRYNFGLNFYYPVFPCLIWHTKLFPIPRSFVSARNTTLCDVVRLLFRTLGIYLGSKRQPWFLVTWISQFMIIINTYLPWCSRWRRRRSYFCLGMGRAWYLRYRTRRECKAGSLALFLHNVCIVLTRFIFW